MQNEKAQIASYIRTEKKHSKDPADVLQNSLSISIISAKAILILIKKK